MKKQIAIIGSTGQEEYPDGVMNFTMQYDIAYKLGYMLASNDFIVLTGGKSGIMEGAAKGCKDAGGINIGFIKGPNRGTSNSYVDVEVVTNMGDGGDAFLLPYSADAAIIIGGGVGTLKEIAGFYLQSKQLFAIKGTGGKADQLVDKYIDQRELVLIQGTENSDQGFKELLLSLKKITI